MKNVLYFDYGNIIRYRMDFGEKMPEINEVQLQSIKENIQEFIDLGYTCGEITNHNIDDKGYWTFIVNWSVVEMEAYTMTKVANWHWAAYPSESLTPDIFKSYFGEQMGEAHYYKWEVTYKRDFLKMINYLDGHKDRVQKFCDMVMEQANKFEQRINNQNKKDEKGKGS